MLGPLRTYPNYREAKLIKIGHAIINFSRLTDAKLKTLVPLMVRFRTVKIGGKQDYGVKGIQDLRMYMEELKVGR